MIRLYIFLVCLLLVACFPSAKGYYRPSASTGHLINECGGAIPPETMELVYSSVRVRVSSDGYALRLRIHAPGGATASFDSSNFQLESGREGVEVSIPKLAFYDREARASFAVPATDPMVGKDEAFTFPFVSAATRVFSAHIVLPQPTGEIYTVKLPAILVNGVKHEVPEIRFKKDVGVGMYPINC